MQPQNESLLPICFETTSFKSFEPTASKTQSTLKMFILFDENYERSVDDTSLLLDTTYSVSDSYQHDHLNLCPLTKTQINLLKLFQNTYVENLKC